MVTQITSEEDAIKILIRIREKQGIKCPKCNKITPHRFNERRKSWFCYCNRSETGLKARSILHKSKLPIRVYLNILATISQDPGVYSIKSIQESVGHKYYAPIWRFFHKIGNILSLAQQEDHKPSPEAALIFDDIELITKYLGIDNKINKKGKDPVNKKRRRKKILKSKREMKVNVKALAFSNKNPEIDPNTGVYIIDKLPESWAGKTKEAIEKHLQTNTKCPSEIKSLIRKKLKSISSKDPFSKTPRNTTNIQSRSLREHVLTLYERILKVHKNVDGDYLVSFLAHHSLKDKTIHNKKSTNFIAYLLTNCFSRCWFDYGNFFPPLLARMRYLKLS